MRENENQKFEIEEVIYFDHPAYGKGYGVVIGYNAKENYYHISPSKDNKDRKTVICVPEQLISAPF